MRLIDERGRVFGKVNLIDLLLAVLILAAACLAVPRLLGRGGGGDGGVKMNYTVLVEAMTPETYASVLEHVPSQLMASGALLDGQVLASEGQVRAVYTEEGGGLTLLEETLLLDVVFSVEVTVPRQNVMLNTVGNQEVRIGKEHFLKTEYFELLGTITTAEWRE